MTRGTKTTLTMGAWSLTSGAGALYFADMLDGGHHHWLAVIGLGINVAQLAVAMMVLMVISLDS